MEDQYKNKKNNSSATAVLNRRKALLGITGAAAATTIVLNSSTVAHAQNQACTLSPSVAEGPFWVDKMINRSDIRMNRADNTISQGVPLTLTINVYSVTSSGCSPLPNAQVDIWQADAAGKYSDNATSQTVGMDFLRGYQTTDAAGQVRFTTIYPGWSAGRAVHLNIRIRTMQGTTTTGNFTTELFFNDTMSDAVLANAPYNTRGARDTRNDADPIYATLQNKDRALMALSQTNEGFEATVNIGVNLQGGPGPNPGNTTAFALPQAAFGGGWYTAIYLANTTNATATATLNVVNANGSPLPITLPGGTPNATQTLTIPARGSTIVELPNTAGSSLTQGWVEAQLPQGVVGYAVFRQSVTGRPNQEAVVPLSTQTATQVSMVYDDTTGFTTGVALVNPGNTQTTLTITAYSATGTIIGTGNLTLPARSRTSVSLREISGLAGIGGTRGWVSINSTGGVVSAMGLRFGQEAFTSIPVTAV
jgi:protocatechuate 3,4-dioxygenase beta subunit